MPRVLGGCVFVSVRYPCMSPGRPISRSASCLCDRSILQKGFPAARVTSLVTVCVITLVTAGLDWELRDSSAPAAGYGFKIAFWGHDSRMLTADGINGLICAALCGDLGEPWALLPGTSSRVLGFSAPTREPRRSNADYSAPPKGSRLSNADYCLLTRRTPG